MKGILKRILYIILVFIFSIPICFIQFFNWILFGKENKLCLNIFNKINKLSD